MNIVTFKIKHWVDTSAGGLLVPNGVIGSLVGVAGLTWFMLLLRKWMDVNEHERLSNITLRHILKLSNDALIAFEI